MSLDKTDINQRIRKVVVLCTGLQPKDVRPAKQNGPATGDSWASVLILNAAGDENAVHKWADVPDDPDKNITETADRHVRITASIQVFRNDALLLAEKLRDRITLSSALQLMQSLGLGFVKATPVRDLSAVVNENWEDRASVDIDFYVVSTEEDVLPTFGRFPMQASTETSSTTFEVTES